MISKRIIALVFLFISFLHYTTAQKISVSGIVRDTNQKPIENVSVFIPSLQWGTITDRNGFFEWFPEVSGEFNLVFSFIGFETLTRTVNTDLLNNIVLNIFMTASITDIEELVITDQAEIEGKIAKIDFRSIGFLPGVSKNIESIIKSMQGVSSRNEMSYQYSVRGGNFDENLVYINGIEIYRPMLIRSGHQEGLSIVNPSMVSSVSFSAGGFDAQYGDKMSSVLNITYRKPIGFAGSASASLLGGNFHVEGISDNKKFTHISSFRYKGNSLLLGSLESKGEFNPSFADFQTFLTWQLSPKTDLSVMGNYSENKFNFIPETRETTFGTFTNTYGLRIYFDGQELNNFRTIFGAMSLDYKPASNTSLIFSVSAFETKESETFDIHGRYLINELDNRIGSVSYGDSIMNIGIGSFLDHARNYLDARVLNLSHKGKLRSELGTLRWGAAIKYSIFDNQMNEWKLIDSAGFSIPDSENSLILNDLIRSDSNFEKYNLSTYVQHTERINVKRSELVITGGMRSTYLSLNDRWYFSPRASLSLLPANNDNLKYFFSTGVYYQPAFFKEIRDFYGGMNKDILPQKSVHFIIGVDYQFWWWNRPFRLVSELYFKHLSDIIPYVTDNVRILYSGNNYAEGFATGLDFKINGEFVKGLESWASLSILRTRERISNEFTGRTSFTETKPGEFIARPTDQLVNFALFFQDFLPMNPNYKVHLQLAYASKLPFHPPQKELYGNIFRMPSYKRVDIGFSSDLLNIANKNNTLSKYFKNLWLGVEVFNLLDIKNTVSYLWINSVAVAENMPVNMAVPNFLSGRRLNLRVSAYF